MNGCIKKLILILFISFFVIGFGIYIISKYTRQIMRESIQYETSKKIVLQDTLLRKEIGEIIEISEDVGGILEHDWSSVSYEVKGSNKTVLVTTELIYSEGEWRLQKFLIK